MSRIGLARFRLQHCYQPNYHYHVRHVSIYPIKYSNYLHILCFVHYFHSNGPLRIPFAFSTVFARSYALPFEVNIIRSKKGIQTEIPFMFWLRVHMHTLPASHDYYDRTHIVQWMLMISKM